MGGAGVTSVAFAPDSKTLVSASQAGQVIRWSATTGNDLMQWELPGAVNGVTYATDGRHLALANANGTVYILRLGPSPKGS
jgi:WD40 repeat protein